MTRQTPGWKSFAAAVLIVLLSIGVSHLGRAGTPQAFLKVNQYYVLFTNPVIPFINQQGNFIVGLTGFADVLGAHVSSARGVTTVRLGNDVVRFIEGSKTADINGKSVHMAEAAREQPTLQYKPNARAPLPPGFRRPMIPATQLLVPVAALVRAFHLHASWQPHRRTLLVRQDQPLPEDSDIVVENIWRFERPAPISDSFVPSSVCLRSGALSHYKIDQAVSLPAARFKGLKLLELTAKNTSGQDFIEGQAFINIFSSVSGHGAIMPSIDIPDTPPAALKTGAMRSDLTEINGPSSLYAGYVQYVIAWLVVRNQ